MKKMLLASLCVCVCVCSGVVFADTFGTGGNQFTIDFVPISGDSGDLGSWSAGSGYTFSGVNHGAYRMGKYQITNDQWNKFKAELGVPVTGSPSSAYDTEPLWTGTIPTNQVSWYEAAQFVNWLNTSSGHQAAYKFTGTQGTEDYTLEVWDASEAWGGTNLFRHKDAHYFLPSEDEWVKAAYWRNDDPNLQTWATVGDVAPVAGTDSNYDWANSIPWNVGSGSEELNGTYDMMGNVWEWMESPYSGDYLSDSNRVVRGGSFGAPVSQLSSSTRGSKIPDFELHAFGFRVASVRACPSADLTNDCFVDLEDLGKFASEWLTGRQ